MTALHPLLGRPGVIAALAVLSAIVALAGGEMGGGALRGGAVLALLAAGHYALRRMRARTPAPVSPSLVVSERCALGRDVGIALVRAGDRRLVVGWAPSGVSLVAELVEARDAP